jgi:hypothetical protein
VNLSNVLELILVGSKIFHDERKEQFAKRCRSLLRQIAEVEDAPFHLKDMEQKGIAERQLLIEVEDLRKAFILEASK